MFRSPPQLRSGSKGKAIALSATDKKPGLQRSLSAPSPSGPTSSTTMPTDKTAQLLDPALVERCVNSYLSGEAIVTQLVSRLSAEMKTIVEVAVRAALTAVNEEIKKLREEVTTLTAVAAELDGKLADRTDDLEQYQRRDNLRIFGIEETVGEDTDRLVVELCRDKLGLDLPAEAISRSHRVGQQPRPAADGGKRHRPIIVRFTGYRQRQRVFSAKKKLKSTGISIREDLTARRMEVFRAAVAQHGPRNTWTLDGRVLWVDQRGGKGAATRLADLAPASLTSTIANK